MTTNVPVVLRIDLAPGESDAGLIDRVNGYLDGGHELVIAALRAAGPKWSRRVGGKPRIDRGAGPGEVPVLLEGVDWSMLRAQKLCLVDLVDLARERQGNPFHQTMSATQIDHLNGLIHFLDHVQDRAAEVLGEKIVFGRSEIADDQDEDQETGEGGPEDDQGDDPEVR